MSVYDERMIRLLPTGMQVAHFSGLFPAGFKLVSCRQNKASFSRIGVDHPKSKPIEQGPIEASLAASMSTNQGLSSPFVIEGGHL